MDNDTVVHTHTELVTSVPGALNLRQPESLVPVLGSTLYCGHSRSFEGCPELGRLALGLPVCAKLVQYLTISSVSANSGAV